MRNLIALLLLLSICNFSIASNQASSKVHWNKYEPEKVTVNDIITDKSYLNLSKFDDLTLKASRKDELGFTHHTYKQFHKKIPVENAVVIIHENNGLVSLTNGSTAHNFNANTTPSINETSALKMALDFVSAKLYAWEVVEYEQALCKVSNNTQSTFYPTGELVWYKNINSNNDVPYKLTYKFDVYSIEPNTRQYIYVDAENGNIIESINRIANCTNTLATGETNYYNTVSFSACEEHGIYHLKNIDNTHIEVFDANQTRFTYQNQVIDTDNHFEENKAASEVFWASQNIYQYFKETYNRNSIDDEGMSILSWVNYANEAGNKNSAFWNGDWMTFGSGDGKHYNSRTSTDIVAHELMHGINDFTANLVYKNEPGALDESFSDIFGEVIEAYTKGSNDWLIGAETIADSSKTALRSLSNPKDSTIFHQQPNTYKGENWWTSIADNGGVHYNSGVQNYWFYLLTEGGIGVNDNNYAYIVEPIGIDKAAAIAYRNLAYYLTAYSNFEDAKNGAIQAATELFGADSNEAKQTELAWRAVGIGKQNDEPLPGIEPTPNDNIDSIALINLYNATNLNNTWVNDWDLTKPMEEWYGVTINDIRRVIKLELPANGLNGEITSELKTMDRLEVLNLSNNQLSGLFPQLEHPYRLHEVNLSNNNLTGQLPDLRYLHNVKILNLSDNNFIGSIFIKNYWAFEGLVTLNLSNNQLSGNISFTVAHLPNIEHLYLNNNLFTGKLLSDLAVIPNLKTLHLQNNLFSGCISNKYGKFCDSNNEVDFDMSGNNLPFNISEFCMYEDSGCWGPEAGACRVTDSLNLYVLLDYIDRGGWEKTIPIKDWWGVTRNADGCVVGLRIGEDDEGILPPEIGNFKHLEILSADESCLHGPIPPEIGLLSELRALDLSDSGFRGEVPSEIGQLQQLKFINLNYNHLSGSISFLENMPALSACYLSDNYFSGPFPLKIASEKHINIDNNYFFGCYPDEALSLCDKYDDYEISNGNNFDISWSEFCNEGVQACASFPSCRTKDSLTLVKIHQSLINNDNEYDFWNFDTPIDTWNGVTLNEFGCVSELKFFENPVFYGSLPAEIGDLQSLETLVIYDCFLPGEIPAEIGNLPLLTTLSLPLNELSGKIPPEILYPDLLVDLNLNGNQLSGEIPDEFDDDYSRIVSLDLGSNNLSGEIPKSIGDNSKLRFLDLSRNNLTGSLPYNFGKIKNLNYLDVTYNQLSANCLNSNLKQLCNAEVKLIGENTNLEQNNFNTTWDTFCNSDESVCNICRYTDSLTLIKVYEKLEGLDDWYFNYPINNWPGISLNDEGCVDGIQIGDQQSYTNLSGSIAPEIGDLQSLRNLSIINTDLSGEIPVEIGNLTNLEFLFLNSNNIEGSIPSELMNLKQLDFLDLSDNQLQGEIPSNIGELSNLRILNLHDNNLQGELPSSVSNLLRLINFGIQNNNLSGCFAQELKTLCSRDVIIGSEHIDLGNNFDSFWEDFCYYDIGNCSHYQTCRQTDSLTLVKLGENLKDYYSEDIWPIDKPIDNWNGITLNEDGCVKDIQFIETGLQGFLSPEIGDLKSLENLLIIDCGLSGEIPKEIGNLTRLKMLGLNSNNLEGQIPDEITQLTKLNSLSLGLNNLTGGIPAEIGNLANLTYIDVGGNDLGGTLPSSIANLNVLNTLTVNDNNIEGCFPAQLTKLCSQFTQPQAIDAGNNFDATWEEFCNSGTGACPEIITCRQTDSLTLVKIHEHLKGNGNNFWNLNTPIDTWEGIELNEEGCVSWFQFGPQNNLNFNTNLPAEIGDLKNLVILHSSYCNLTGEIPKEIANLTELEILSLGNNQLQGNIPQELEQLKNLNVLTLGNNKLVGDIPFYIGEFDYLSWLELNDNQLTGSIPASFADSEISILNIGNNNLSGCYEPKLSKLCNQLDTDTLHRVVDTGNNFDATWDDFCNAGVGACFETVATCRQTDSLTLIKIHNHLKGENGNDFWSLDTLIDTWEGVALNEDGCVKELFLSNINFSGSLPPEIGDLQDLEYLKIINCWTGGEIPKEIGNLSKLVSLELESNFLSGNIPKEIMQLKNLYQLDLSYNSLEGSIPQNIDDLSKLSILNLKHNNFRGGLPASLVNLNEIAFIDVSENYLTGCFAPILKQICDDYDVTIQVGDYFDATWNDFCNSGAAACVDTVATCRQTDSLTLLKIHEHLKGDGDDFWDLSTPIDTWTGVTLNEESCVHWLDVSQTNLKFNTSIPAEIADLRSLEFIGLSDSGLTGSIPIEITNLDKLQILVLSDNNLTGTIPNEIANLVELDFLQLGNNNLEGNIPSELAQINQFEGLELYGNNLSGSIPASFADSDMYVLNVANNNLSGCYAPELNKLCNQLYMEFPIFPSIIDEGNNFDATWDDFCNTGAGTCTTNTCRISDSLNLIILSDSFKPGWDKSKPIDQWRGIELNKDGCVVSMSIGHDIEGTLPPEIGNFSQLESLTFYENRLTGPIPPEIGKLSKLTRLDLLDNRLTGTIPPEIGNLENLTYLDLGWNYLEGEFPLELLSNFNGTVFLTQNNFSGCYPEQAKQLCSKYTQFQISNSNNFDATWDDFCNLGAGTCTKIETCRKTDSLTLVKIHESLKGTDGNQFWDFSTPIDTWQGITLNVEGCVDRINFNDPDSIDFKGYIPANIGDLTSLTELSFINCNIGGTIPGEIGNLLNLQSLSLYGNQLEGEIPIELLQLKNLSTLNLHSNNLSGSIPGDIGQLSDLFMISFFNNNLTGNLPLSIANLDKLVYLYVDANNLSGCYHPGLKPLCNQLSYPLIHSGNNFDATWDDFCAAGSGTCTEIETCRQTDSLTLIKIHEHLKGENGDNFWPIYTPLDTWEGILTLNEKGCVKQITCGPQHNLNFGTNLPPEIGDLKSLEGIIISYCNLTGEIPKEIGNLSELDFLSLGNNQLEGNIPNELTELKNLNVLHLGNNNFQGTIPSFIGEFEYLSWLELNDNQLIGEIPVSFGNSNLQLLNIGNNNLSGCYNIELSNLCGQLDMSFPSIVSEGNNFDTTWEDFCNSDAGICSEIGSCKTDSLNLLILADYINKPSWDKTNPFDTWEGITRNANGCVTSISIGDDVIGTLPPEIGNFSELEYLDAAESAITGPIPPEIGQLTNLKKIDFYDTYLTGSIPAEIGNLINLTYLDLEYNNLSGGLPLEMANLSNLTHFALEHCNLTGDLNTILSSLSNLEYLNLAQNKFTGSISFLENMPLLDICNLSYNAFSGIFPSDLATQMNLNISHNNFSGCYLEKAKTLCSKYTNYEISNGNNFDATWDDFCSIGTGTCIEDSETVIVWPGDMDNNGVVNANDLLYYGLAEGRTGEERENATAQWQEQKNQKWNNIVAGVNGAHQDADGNGIVDKADIEAIFDNYGKTHLINVAENIYNPLSLDLKLLSSAKYDGLEELVFDLYAKNNTGGAPNIYGISANINFSDLPVKEVNVDFSQSSLKPTEHLSYFNTSTGVLDLSLTRTDKTNIVVSDPVARLIVILDDFPTGDPYDIKIEGGSFATVNGGLSGISSSSFYGNHNTNEGISNDLQAYVNTTNQQCNSKGSATAIINGGVAPYSIKWNNGSSNETLTNLEADAYSLHVTDAAGNTAQTNFIIYGTLPVYNQNGTLICGTTCPDYLSPTTTMTDRIFKSAQIINASSAYTRKQTIEFNAGDTITLDKGFYIGPEVDFSATIEQCE